MKKNLSKKSFILVLGLLLLSFALAGCGSSGEETDASEVTKLTASFLAQIDTWPTYAGTLDGTDEKYGLDIELMFFESGMPQIETIPAKQWQIADTGNVPGIMASLRYDTQIIGLASDESPANAVMARPDSPVFKTQGANSEFPEVFGTAEDVKGKTFLVTTVSSAHYTLSSYLKTLGLTESDVVVKNLEQAQAVKAFESGEGDFIVLWTPYMYRGFEKGWKMVADASQCGAKCLMVFLAEKDFAKEHPDLVAKFLAADNEKAKVYLNDGVKLVPEIQSYFKDWCAMDITAEDVKLDIETHKIYTLEEQLEIFDSGQLEEWLLDAATFFVSQKKFTSEELGQLKAKHFNINPEFLIQALEVKPVQ
ncbi:MAG: NrtA/SsuA/CpmA family ABC transporter substrate-binding protein [Dehalobacterium sp.]